MHIFLFKKRKSRLVIFFYFWIYKEYLYTVKISFKHVVWFQCSVGIAQNMPVLLIVRYKTGRVFSLLSAPLKSDLNEVLFVLELGELSINNKITTIWNLKKNYTNKSYLNNYFLIHFVVLSKWKWTPPLF